MGRLKTKTNSHHPFRITVYQIERKMSRKYYMILVGKHGTSEENYGFERVDYIILKFLGRERIISASKTLKFGWQFGETGDA